MDMLDNWRARLHDYGLEISTGPVVPFRARELLVRQQNERTTYPMLWMQHVRASSVSWPLGDSFRKEEHILAEANPKLLVPNGTYILLRRFSAKEEPRRLTAAVLKKGEFAAPFLGFENHLNYIHQPGGVLELNLARGLEALLNSSTLDNYFRMTNGNTQVSATEIRSMPLPEARLTTEIGRRLAKKNAGPVDHIMNEVLCGQS
jgi:adenine-specific DNA-methyltransferase